MGKPYIINGGIYSDNRGSLKYVNDFSLAKVKRFYSISMSPESEPRAWQGHKEENKYFYCVKGSFIINLVKIDNWENPNTNLDVLSFFLSENKSEILVIPGGYANGIKAKEQESRLLVFSEKTINESEIDEQKYESALWINWEKV
jgi:dTDP-4-dehydrorhamnose 3,5-epimerase